MWAPDPKMLGKKYHYEESRSKYNDESQQFIPEQWVVFVDEKGNVIKEVNKSNRELNTYIFLFFVVLFTVELILYWFIGEKWTELLLWSGFLIWILFIAYKALWPKKK